jgi:23S rRNA (cytosine1962-C5)-methyltransferase
MIVKDYELLDSGDGRKLERLGTLIMDRQSPVAFWKKSLRSTEWEKADAVHVRSEKGGGHWEFSRKNTAQEFIVELGVLKIKSKLTSFGHLGFFPEQIWEWPWFESSARGLCQNSAPKILNLFGYTGGSSLALAMGGADVTHVDAAKGVVDWGKENQLLNPVTHNKIRWIVDDCEKFLEKEIRRGNRYDGFVMDPPTFGRGSKNEIFRIEENILGILEKLQALCGSQPKLFHFSCHTPGWTPFVLKNLLSQHFETHGTLGGDLSIRNQRGGLEVPSGSFVKKASSGT